MHGLHTSRFQMDEEQLALGAALHAEFVLEFFRQHGDQEHHQEL